MIHLSRRLAAVARYVPDGSRLLDVGSDHAYLPIVLSRNGVIRCGVASEVARGPYLNMRHNLFKTGVIPIVQPRMADGLSAIHEKERFDVITIAGMGGRLITQILERGLSRLQSETLLILQPNVGTDLVRKWLMNHQYRIIHERIVEDDDHIYEIVVARHVQDRVRYNQQQLIFGPLLLRQRDPVFVKKWGDEVRHLRTVVSHMKLAKSHRPVRRIHQIVQRIRLIQQVI